MKPNKQKEKIKRKLWKQVNSLLELRRKNFEDLYQENWWNYLIEDEFYKFLCQKLAEIKLMNRPTYLVKRKLTKDEIKELASGFKTVEDFMKDINIIDLDMNLDKNNDQTKQTKKRLEN